MTIDAKFLNQILANQIQKHILKRLYIITEWDLTLEYKVGLMLEINAIFRINRIKNELKTQPSLTDARKAFYKVQHRFMMKILSKQE